jgi:hypothetical protein
MISKSVTCRSIADGDIIYAIVHRQPHAPSHHERYFLCHVAIVIDDISDIHVERYAMDNQLQKVRINDDMNIRCYKVSNNNNNPIDGIISVYSTYISYKGYIARPKERDQLHLLVVRLVNQLVQHRPRHRFKHA